MITQHLTLADLESFDSRSPQRGKERRFLCPVCGQNKPRDAAHRSLAVNTETGGFLCHRCQTKGRLREFWEVRPIMKKKQKTRLKIMSHFSLDKSESSLKKEEKTESKSENLAEKMRKYQADFLHSPAEIYLDERGISTEIAINAGCGYAENWEHWEKQAEKWILKGADRRVVFPIYDEKGSLVAIHGRAIDENHLNSSKITRGDKSLGLFLSDAHCLRSKILAVCEGACDALSLAMCGIPSVAMTGTNPPHWFYRKTAFRHILIATDGDEAGDKAAFQIKTEFEKRGTKFFRLRPRDAKDWNEVLLKIGYSEMNRFFKVFQQNLSDEKRFEEIIKLLRCSRIQAAKFAAWLLSDAILREKFLYHFSMSDIFSVTAAELN